MLGIIGGMGPMASAVFYDMISSKTDASCDQENLNLILLRIKILRPNNKATKNTVTALLSKNHLKNQDKVKCFSFCSMISSFPMS